MDQQMMGMCGTYCGICEWKEKTNCPGCQLSCGNVFWGQCAIAKCAIEKGFKHCGYCSELPCEKLQAAYNDPEHGDHGERLINLKNWAEGKEVYLKLRTLNKINECKD